MKTKLDQFSTREVSTVLAALRLFQQVRPCDLCPDGIPIQEMKEFAACTPLDLDEIDLLYDRIRQAGLAPGPLGPKTTHTSALKGRSPNMEPHSRKPLFEARITPPLS